MPAGAAGANGNVDANEPPRVALHWLWNERETDSTYTVRPERREWLVRERGYADMGPIGYIDAEPGRHSRPLVCFYAAMVALAVALVYGTIVLVARLTGLIAEPGYAPTVLLISGFGALNALGLSVVGAYAWRAFENTKARPLAIVRRRFAFGDGETALQESSAPAASNTRTAPVEVYK